MSLHLNPCNICRNSIAPGIPCFWTWTPIATSQVEQRPPTFGLGFPTFFNSFVISSHGTIRRWQLFPRASTLNYNSEFVSLKGGSSILSLEVCWFKTAMHRTMQQTRSSRMYNHQPMDVMMELHMLTTRAVVNTSQLLLLKHTWGNFQCLKWAKRWIASQHKSQESPHFLYQTVGTQSILQNQKHGNEKKLSNTFGWFIWLKSLGDLRGFPNITDISLRQNVGLQWT